MVWIIVAVAVAIFLILLYNSLVSKRNHVDNAFALIDTQLKKRFDLIPNLAASVKSYMKHESETLTHIAELRAQAGSSATPDERIKLAQEADQVLRSIRVQVEAYPQLKADGLFQDLTRSLNEIEEQLSAARRTYNAAVTEFNTSIQLFPYCLFAGMLGFRPRELFAASEEERRNPSVADLLK